MQKRLRFYMAYGCYCAAVCNPLGFRGPENAREKPPGTTRIIALGEWLPNRYFALRLAEVIGNGLLGHGILAPADREVE